jgi:hypothetical protein
VDLLLLALRLVHIVCGVLWVGMAVFTAFFLAPALQDAGPGGGSVMVAIQRRGVLTVIPVLALATLISGFWMYWRDSGGFGPGYMSSAMGVTFGIGGALALGAFAFGITIVMPSMRRVATLTQSVGSLPEQERAARMAEIQRLRTRGAAFARGVSLVLIVAAAAMAVARYV